MDDHSDRRALNRGLGDGMTRAFEIVLTPAVIGAFGWFLDARLDLFPILTVVFTVVGVIGIFVKLWLGYEAEMQGHDDARRRAAEARKAARAA